MSQTIEKIAFDISEEIALRDAWGAKLCELGDRYPELVVLDGDLANSTRADVFQDCHPERFFEMGIAEQNMAGVAAGLATTGFVPWISTFAAFLATRSLDQIRLTIAQPGLNVKLCGSYSGILTSKTGKSHQAVEDIAIFRAMPGVVTIAPADANELTAAMDAMMKDSRPTYLRITRDPSPVIFRADYDFKIGKALWLREGGDVGLIGTGVQTVRVLRAAEILAAQGISASVLHVPTLKPMDTEAIVQIVDHTGRIVTAEEHSVLGGLGSAVAEVVTENYPARINRVGLQDTYGESGPNDALLRKYGLIPEHVVAAALDVMGLA